MALITACLGASLLAACGGGGGDGGEDIATKEARFRQWNASRITAGESTLPGERGSSIVRTSGTQTSPTQAPSPSPSPSAAAPAPAGATGSGTSGGSGSGSSTTGGSGTGSSTPQESPAATPSPAAPSPAPAPSGGSASAPTTPAPAPVAGRVNSVDNVVNDMKLMNDLALAGVPSNYGWAKGPGHVIMGSDARGSHTPSWWTVNNSSYKSNAYWNAILPWFVVFDGVGNSASNTRVQLRNLKLYIKSKSRNAWELAASSTGVSGELYPKSLQGSDVTSPNLRSESDGSTSVLPPGGNLVFHGWGGFSDINGSDIAGLFITVQARLVLNNASGPDDRAKARFLVHVGGDYYPTRSTRVSDLAPSYYFPGVGVSRAKLVTSDWQAFNFATLDVAVQDPGGGVMSEAQFRAAPPPLE